MTTFLVATCVFCESYGTDELSYAFIQRNGKCLALRQSRRRLALLQDLSGEVGWTLIII